MCNHNNGNENIIKHQWKKGQSGNPAGRPKDCGISFKLKNIIEAEDGKVADALAKAITRYALKGDPRFVNIILDRLEGKVADKVQLTGEGGGPVQINIIRGTDPRKKRDDGD